MAKETENKVPQGWEGGKEVDSNWFKFEKIGDGIKGTLLSKRLQKGQDDFPDQYVYEIKTDDGVVFNVGISVNKIGTVARLNNCKVGEIVGVRFDSEGEPSKKGFAAPKLLKVFSFGMDPNYNAFEGGQEVNSDRPVVPEM